MPAIRLLGTGNNSHTRTHPDLEESEQECFAIQKPEDACLLLRNISVSPSATASLLARWQSAPVNISRLSGLASHVHVSDRPPTWGYVHLD